VTSENVDTEALENEFEPVDDIMCYECMLKRFSACIWLDGECQLDLF
jgi:hypothetical protein